MKMYGKLKLIISRHGIFLYNKVFSKNSQEREKDLLDKIQYLSAIEDRFIDGFKTKGK